MEKRRSPKYTHLLQIGIVLGVLLVINLLAGFKFFRYDLTEDKIHSISSSTQQFLEEEIDDIVNIEIYLQGGDLPPILQKFKQSIKDKVQEFQAYTGNKIKYSFVDITSDTLLFNDRLKAFSKSKVQSNLFITQINGAQKDYEFYPIAQMRKGSYVYMVDFMSEFNAVSPVSENYIDAQTNAIEYKLLTGLHYVTGKAKPTISFLRGHNEPPQAAMSSTVKALEEFYNVDSVYIAEVEKYYRPLFRNQQGGFSFYSEDGRIRSFDPGFFDTLDNKYKLPNGNFLIENNLGWKFELDTLSAMDTTLSIQDLQEQITRREKIDALDNTDLLVINQPQFALSDEELFLIDQFIMRGGRTIWNIGMVDPHEDSLFFPIGYSYSSINTHLEQLEGMLYKYGAGIKKNFVTNEICASQLRHDQRYRLGQDNRPRRYPMTPSHYEDINGNKLPIEPVIKNWYPFPCVTKDESELTHNLGRVKLKYPSEININEGSAAKATTILETDLYYKVFPGISRIYYDKNYMLQDVSNRGEISGEYYDPRNIMADGSRKPLGVLLEGSFKTAFPKSAISQTFIDGMSKAGFDYRGEVENNALAVIGSGQLITDEYIVDKHGPHILNANMDFLVNGELAYGNTAFFQNLVDKMMGNEHLIPLRSRMKTYRKLNEDAIYYSRGKWQAINLLIPTIIVLVFGVIQIILRRRKFTSNK